MKTTLTPEGLIDLSRQIREADHLCSGDSFEVRRLGAGQYLLERELPILKPVAVVEASDGRQIFRGGGRITSEMVRDLESQTQ